MDLNKIKEAREILSAEVGNNMKMQGTDLYYRLCLSVGELNILIKKLEKKNA